jgi:hypothetical protein
LATLRASSKASASTGRFSEPSQVKVNWQPVSR